MPSSPRPPLFSIPAFVKALVNLQNRPYFLLIAAAAMWAGNTIMSKVVAHEVSPMLMTFLRWVIVSIIAWPLAMRSFQNHWPVARTKLPQIVWMCLFGLVANNALIYLAAHYTSAVNIAIFQGAMPIFVLIGVVVFFSLRVSWQQICGIGLTMVGVIAIALKGDIASLTTLSFNIGDIYMLLAALSYAGYTLLLRSKPAISGLVFFTLLTSFAALCSIPLVLMEYFSGLLQWPSLMGWVICLWVAIFPSLLAQLSYIRAVEIIGPARAGIFMNFIPVFGSFLAVILLGEAFQLDHLLGLSLVLAGVWLAERK